MSEAPSENALLCINFKKLSVHLFFKKYTDKIKIYMHERKMVYILSLDEIYCYCVYKLFSCHDCKPLFNKSFEKVLSQCDELELSRKCFRVLMDKLSPFFRNKYLHPILKDKLYKQCFLHEQISLIKKAMSFGSICICNCFTLFSEELKLYDKEIFFASYFCNQLNQ